MNNNPKSPNRRPTSRGNATPHSRSTAGTNSPKTTNHNYPAPKKSGNGGATFTVNKNTVKIAVIAVLLIMNIIAFASITQRRIPERLTPAQVEENSRLELEAVYESPFEVHTIKTSDYLRGSLILVNGTYPYVFDYKGEKLNEPEILRVNTRIQNRTFKAADNNILLGDITIDALNLMFADFYAETGKNDVMLNSAHRTKEQQQSILDKKIQQLGADQQIAQTPGNSEHHTGFAFDISIYPDGGAGARTFTGDGVYSWIYENCNKYGFILRYPEGKTEITGIAPESWHFRYVGVPHSTYIYERNMTLEEYISEIRIYTENVPLIVDVSETESYGVYYVKKVDGLTTEFNVPKNTEYFISGDNAGGFIVWYKNTSESE